jgi:hypothetical protein
MLELFADSQPVVLTPGTSVQAEINSPLFDEEVLKGSYTYAFTVPGKPNGPQLATPSCRKTATSSRSGPVSYVMTACPSCAAR